MTSIQDRVGEIDQTRFYDLGELSALDLNRKQVHRLVQAGVLVSPIQGVFHHPDKPIHELDDLAIVAKRYPDAVFNLYTAAKHWDITQVEPSDIWLAIDAARGKKVVMGDSFYTPVRTILTSREANLQVGINEFNVAGVTIKMTDPSRTVVDMWRMSSFSAYKTGTKLVVRDETMFQCLAAYMEKDGNRASDLADMIDRIGFSDKVTDAFKDFLKTYSNGYEAQNVM